MTSEKKKTDVESLSDIVKNTQIFNLSQAGWAVTCDTYFNPRIKMLPYKNVNFEQIENNEKVFLSNEQPNFYQLIPYIVNKLQCRGVRVYFYIMGEPNIHYNIIEQLLPVTIHMFVQNNIYNHPKVHVLPIGIRDCESIFTGHKGFNHKYLFDEKYKKIEKDILCLLCFTVSNPHRIECYNKSQKPFIKNLNIMEWGGNVNIQCGKVPIEDNYHFTHRSIYALSPQGYGVACHRFWECIYLNTIPIVLRTNTVFDKLFQLTPCLIVDSWDDVTEEYLLKKKDECQLRLENFHEKYPNAFTDPHSLTELLIKT